jgi:hypothetical protein
MAYVNVSNFIASLSERFHEAVDTVAWQAEYNLNTPLEQMINN